MTTLTKEMREDLVKLIGSPREDAHHLNELLRSPLPCGTAATLLVSNMHAFCNIALRKAESGPDAPELSAEVLQQIRDRIEEAERALTTVADLSMYVARSCLDDKELIRAYVDEMTAQLKKLRKRNAEAADENIAH